MIIVMLVKNELKQLFRDKAALVLLFSLPCLFIALFAGTLGPYLNSDRFSDRFAIAVVDRDDTPASRLLLQQFESATNAKGYITIYYTDQTSALSLLKNNKVSCSIEIPPGFIDSVYAGRNKPITFTANPTMSRTASLIKNELESAANQVSASQSAILSIWRYTKWGGGNQALLERQFNESALKFSLAALGRGRIFAAETVSSYPDVTPAEYFTAALLSIFAAFLALRGVKSMVEEKSPGMKQRFKLSPVKPWQLLLGKGLFVFNLVAAQLIVVVLASGIVFKTYLGSSVFAMALMFVASAFAAAAWAMFITALAPGSQAADLIAYLGTPLLALIGGSVYPLSSLPPTVQVLSRFSFSRWVMDGFMRIFAGDTSVSGDALALLAIGSALLGLAGLLWQNSWRKI